MISVSMLSSYSYCARKLYFNYVLGISGQKKEVISGKVKHQVLEYMNKMEREIVNKITSNMNPEAIEELYRSNYYRVLMFVIDSNKEGIEAVGQKKMEVFSEAWQPILGEAKLRAANVASFVASNSVYGDELWDKLTPKYFSEMSVASQELGLRGRIDKIEHHSNGMVIPLEMKSGNAPNEGIWPNHKIQLASYMLLLSGQYKNVREGYVEYIDAKERRKLVLNPFIEDEIKELIMKVKILLGSKDIPPKADCAAKCAKCEIREQCFSKV